MSVLIKGMKMPNDQRARIVLHPNGQLFVDHGTWVTEYEAIELTDHGDLIDRDDFSRAMYHEAFEVDSDMQKWESGCWIRYKMFERIRDSAPVVIPTERSEDGRR